MGSLLSRTPPSLFFSGAGGWRGAPKRLSMLGRKRNSKKGKRKGEKAGVWTRRNTACSRLAWKLAHACITQVHAIVAKLEREFQETSRKKGRCASGKFLKMFISEKINRAEKMKPFLIIRTSGKIWQNSAKRSATFGKIPANFVKI